MDTPVPIPNTEVKHFRAENSWRYACKHRSLPSFLSIFLKRFLKKVLTFLKMWYNNTWLRGGLAQLGEHLPYKQGVAGSSPAVSTILLKDDADLAQLVEQLTCNQ